LENRRWKGGWSGNKDKPRLGGDPARKDQEILTECVGDSSYSKFAGGGGSRAGNIPTGSCFLTVELGSHFANTWRKGGMLRVDERIFNQVNRPSGRRYKNLLVVGTERKCGTAIKPGGPWNKPGRLLKVAPQIQTP